ncbi:MAG: response regulator transcription factor [Pseudomonadota bacterium]
MDRWRPSTRLTLLSSAIALAVAAFGLEQLDYRHAARSLSTEAYLLVVAAAFAGLGGFVGWRLTRGRATPDAFERNDAAIRSLGLSPRELEVLELLAAGRANKEIARTLDVSPNTVKTHLSNLYRKLEAGRRTEAVDAARRLRLIP